MKTFENSSSIQITSGINDWRVIFPMYILRALSVTTIISLFFYAIEALLAMLPNEKFQEFVFDNIIVFIIISLFLSLLQVLFYIYRSIKGKNLKRSIGEVIIGYALPLLGIIAALYAAYAVGAT